MFVPDLFYLDISTTFPLTDPPFTLVQNAGQPLISHHAACPSGSKIVIYGGRESKITSTSVRTFNPDNLQWQLETSDFGTLKRYEATCAVNDISPGDGWLFGGLADSTTVSNLNSTYVFKDIARLQAGTSTFTHITGDKDRPGPRWDHASAVLDDGRVVMVGGVVQTGNAAFALAPMTQVDVYNPSTNSWTTQNVGGDSLPTPRRALSATAYGHNIIVYGGTDNNFASYYSDMAMLDTSTWTWKTGLVSGGPIGRFGHTAAMVDSQNMVVAFGYTNNGADPRVYIFNAHTNQWMDAYTPAPTGLGAGAIIGIIIGTFVLLGLLAFLVMFLIRRKKSRDHEKAMRDGGVRPGVVPMQVAYNQGASVSSLDSSPFADTDQFDIASGVSASVAAHGRSPYGCDPLAPIPSSNPTWQIHPPVDPNSRVDLPEEIVSLYRGSAALSPAAPSSAGVDVSWIDHHASGFPPSANISPAYPAGYVVTPLGSTTDFVQESTEFEKKNKPTV